MPVAGRHRGTTHGTAGMTMIHGIGIPGTGAIRSTIPHGMVGAILGITLLGIRLATTAITGIIAPGMEEVMSVTERAVVCRLTCVAMIAGTTIVTAPVVLALGQELAMWA